MPPRECAASHIPRPQRTVPPPVSGPAGRRCPRIPAASRRRSHLRRAAPAASQKAAERWGGGAGEASGSKIRFRGRMMKIRIERGTEKTVQVRYRNGFLIEVPDGLSPTEQSSQVEAALSAWLKAKLYEDASALIQQVSRQIEVKPKGLRLREQKHLWGSCGKDGIIYLNWRLIHAPRPVLEYAVVHELCHLRFRTHSNEFWMLVRSVLPDYETRKRWLDEAGELVGSRG
ncbi:MAG: M48 family metallopeptidase [Candidatus Sericytochromatia bacterium]|nr:M48 family metallopeptidase [Candidatus Sericytochromatia bacterium]